MVPWRYCPFLVPASARRAAAEIAGRMQPAGSAMKTAQPIMQAPVTAVPRAHARAAYGRNAMQPGIPTAAPAAPPEAAARAHVQNFVPPAAPVAPVAARLPGAYAKPDNS